MPPDPPPPPQWGTAYARSKYSPVTLYYSPATTILNENPADTPIFCLVHYKYSKCTAH